jgi:D-alanyl-D-alanine carboxypeptidase
MHIPAIRFGKRITPNFNRLIGRYPGADGFKTGFICASGYNLVASATRDGRRLIAVVLGASSGRMRAVRAAQLLDRSFANNGLSWLRPSLGTVDNLVPIDASPPNLREEMCGGKRHKPASDEDEDTVAGNAGSPSGGESSATFFAAGLQPPMPKPSELLAQAPAPSEPIPVYTGPTRTGPALVAAVAADADRDAVKSRGKGKKTRVAAKKPDAAAESKSDAKSDAKSEPKPDAKQTAKPAAVRHANAKPDASPPKASDKPAASAAKPAKPKAAAKPKNDTKGEAKPAG